MTDEPIEDALLDAEAALERGDPESALAAAAAAKDPALKAVVETRAYLDLGMLEAAAGALSRASEGLGEDDLDVIELGAELRLTKWDLAGARAEFERLRSLDDGDAYPLERLALCHDFAGEHDAAHELLLAARELDPERPAPTRISDDAFADVVDRALDALPEPYASRLDGVRIVTEPMPFEELVDPHEPGLTPPDLLGLFLGPTIHDLAEEVSAELPPTIYLFQRNLERMVGSVDELQEEIRVTLFHEFGHYLGLDEDEVAGMGLA